MNEVIVDCNYIEKKSSKVAKLVSQDVAKNQVVLVDQDNNQFTVKLTVFKKSWESFEVVDKVQKDVTPLSVEEFVAEVSKYRPCKITLKDGDYEIRVDNDFKVAVISVKESVLDVTMLPDLYLSADWELKPDFSIKDAGNIFVLNMTIQTTLENILATLVEAVESVNIYGYTFD